jgi:hypothetical protein
VGVIFNQLVEMVYAPQPRKMPFWLGQDFLKSRSARIMANESGWDRYVLGSKAFSVFWRTISHIKIVYQPGSLIS